MALTLTENLIRNRVSLTHENLEDIKSLSLPGTFHEKIVSLGTSLRKFSRIKSLDFSRNALESLEGLDQLKLLERLNLYYNNVATLEELTKLRHNQNLKELDLRLNPVTRNEPDYRLYLIHMLPNLQKLDDRGVRDRERQAALTHFSTCQAAEMVSQASTAQTPPKPVNPRTEALAKLMNRPSVLADDDVAIIDIMKRNGGDFGAPRPLTGSAAKEDSIENYSLDGLKILDGPKPAKHRDKPMDDENLKVLAAAQSQGVRTTSSIKPVSEGPYPHIMSSPSDNVRRIGEDVRRDPHLMFPDQEEAHSKYRGQGYFTPHPGCRLDGQDNHTEDYHEHHSLQEEPLAPRQYAEQYSKDDSIVYETRRHRSHSVPRSRTDQDATEYGSDFLQRKLLSCLLNLVDRYWNGSKSLHKHSKFTEQALKILCELPNSESDRGQEMRSLQLMVKKLKEENMLLQTEKQVDPRLKDVSSEEELKLSLKRAKDDMARLHEEVRHYVKENRILQKTVEDFQAAGNISRNQSGAAASESLFTNQDDLHRQNQALTQEIELMRARLKQLGQVQELASMLQESHKSLVETNEHLLRELQETKHKHQQEVEQMHWSYDQLKSTLTHQSSLRSCTINSSLNTNHSIGTSNYYNDSLEMKDV